MATTKPSKTTKRTPKAAKKAKPQSSSKPAATTAAKTPRRRAKTAPQASKERHCLHCHGSGSSPLAAGDPCHHCAGSGLVRTVLLERRLVGTALVDDSRRRVVRELHQLSQSKFVVLFNAGTHAERLATFRSRKQATLSLHSPAQLNLRGEPDMPY